MKPTLNDSLEQLRVDVPRLAELLRLEGGPDIEAWSDILNRKLLPRLRPDLPLLAAICGGGSSGKSSLFNSLVGEPMSPVGGRAGMNRRILLAARKIYFQNAETLSALFEPFGCDPEPLARAEDLMVPGSPLYKPSIEIPENLAVMDTPDFDTGARGAYDNRQIAKQALEASDIMIYVFTNSNYSNRDNTDFIARMLTGIGLRKCFLVYRAYPSFSEAEVIEHAMTVAHNLYGKTAEQNILGIYRTDEDNAVAAGDRFLSLKKVRSRDLPFAEALRNIDTKQLRVELNASILADAVAIAGEVGTLATQSKDALALYLEALEALQSRCTHEALRHFPMDMVIRRFSEIWFSTDPSHIQVMRKTGSIMAWPVKIFAGAIRQAKAENRSEAMGQAGGSYSDKVKEDLINAVNELYVGVVGSEISGSVNRNSPLGEKMIQIASRMKKEKQTKGMPHLKISPNSEKGEVNFVVPTHPAVFPEQEKMIRRDWKSTVQSILSQKDVIITLSENIEVELRQLVDEFRRSMGVWDKLRQSFSAVLNVLPATAAITYVLYTGDPVGGAGIKVKLTGLFGLKDLYALIAIPATSGMKKADQKQLEALLDPIARTWLNHKVKAVQHLFRQEITGDVLEAALKNLNQSNFLTGRVRKIISQIEAEHLLRGAVPGMGNRE